LIPQIRSNTDDTCARQLPKSWLLFSSPPESLTLSLPLLLPCSHLGAEPGQNLFPASFYPLDFYLLEPPGRGKSSGAIQAYIVSIKKLYN
jgi:hypothetical protein